MPTDAGVMVPGTVASTPPSAPPQRSMSAHTAMAITAAHNPDTIASAQCGTIKK
jgi:hypothetical protein